MEIAFVSRRVQLSIAGFIAVVTKGMRSVFRMFAQIRAREHINGVRKRFLYHVTERLVSLPVPLVNGISVYARRLDYGIAILWLRFDDRFWDAHDDTSCILPHPVIVLYFEFHVRFENDSDISRDRERKRDKGEFNERSAGLNGPAGRFWCAYTKRIILKFTLKIL